MFFKSKFIDVEVTDWHTQCWVWLINATGGMTELKKNPLVLPTPDFFPRTETDGHARAEFVLNCIKQAAGMEEWETRLVEQDRLAGRVATFGQVQNGNTAAGTFRANGNQGEITYDPSLLSDSVALVATLAHELGHYLNGTFAHPPPEGIDYIEPATDVTSCFLGFGIFGANAAFKFKQYSEFDSQGWEAKHLGYLSQREWLFSLAIFVGLAEKQYEAARTALKPELRGDFQRACKFVEAEDCLAKIKLEVGSA